MGKRSRISLSSRRRKKMKEKTQKVRVVASRSCSVAPFDLCETKEGTQIHQVVRPPRFHHGLLWRARSREVPWT